MQRKSNVIESKEEKSHSSSFSGWIKEGDFTEVKRESPNILNQSVKYYNKHTKEEMFMGGYAGTDNLKIIYRNKKISKRLLKQCYELEIPVEDDLIGDVILYSNNKNFLAKFINAIAATTSVPEHIVKEMIATLPTTLNQEECKSEPGVVSKWIKQGDFSCHYDSGADLNRSVTYKNLKTLKEEEEIFIGGYKNTDKKQILYQSKNKSMLASIKSKCDELGLPVEYNSIIEQAVRLYTHDKSQLVNFIKVIDSERSLGKVINEEMSKIFDVKPVRIDPQLEELIDSLSKSSLDTPRHFYAHITIFGRRTPSDEKKPDHRSESKFTFGNA